MPPNEQWLDAQLAWKDLRDAYAEGNLDDVEASARELLDWLDQDGVPPQTSADLPMDEHWNRAIVLAACHLVLDAAERRRRDHP